MQVLVKSIYCVLFSLIVLVHFHYYFLRYDICILVRGITIWLKRIHHMQRFSLCKVVANLLFQ